MRKGKNWAFPMRPYESFQRFSSFVTEEDEWEKDGGTNILVKKKKIAFKSFRSLLAEISCFNPHPQAHPHHVLATGSLRR